MGVLTAEQPKCMTEISARETILSRQLRLLEEAGFSDIEVKTDLAGLRRAVLGEYGHVG